LEQAGDRLFCALWLDNEEVVEIVLHPSSQGSTDGWSTSSIKVLRTFPRGTDLVVYCGLDTNDDMWLSSAIIGEVSLVADGRRHVVYLQNIIKR
jgi:hypothetical protein